MSDKQRDPKTGRFVKSGLGIPVRDADDEVIDNLKERLVASASRVSYLESVVSDQKNIIDGQNKSLEFQNRLIDQLQADATEMTEQINTMVTGIKEVVEDMGKVNVVERTGPQLGKIIADYIDDSTSQDMEVPEPKRGYRLIAWGLIIGGCILFWWGFWQVVFGGK